MHACAHTHTYTHTLTLFLSLSSLSPSPSPCTSPTPTPPSFSLSLFLPYRHNSNTLITDRGLLVGIDFGVAFGKGVWALPVPELVPFRLTKQMLGVLSPLDSKVCTCMYFCVFVYMRRMYVHIYEKKSAVMQFLQSLSHSYVNTHAQIHPTCTRM